VALVNEVLDLQAAQRHPFAQFQNIRHGFGGRPFPLRRRRLFFSQSFEGAFQNFCRRAAGVAGELVLEQLLAAGG
jgi:hypothetical protein